ncbi:hypothetical protein [Sporosarcina sp. FSL W7-1283]|uniref:hypothetical protein n=1 Tax=Sporosarcina sp. FSL W7-1283 TaxID=2921560 RepID=UPI0030F4CE16
MTEEKKTVAKKAPAKKASTKKVETENVEVEEEVKKAIPKEEPRRELTNETQVEVMNNTTGRYGYFGRSGFAMEMTEYGDVLEIPFGELKRMRAEQKRHLEDAFIVLLDEDAVKELRYEKLYEGVFNEEGLDELFHNPDKLAKVLPKMPPTMRETAGSIAKRKFENYELTNTLVKKVIEENLNIKIDA